MDTHTQYFLSRCFEGIRNRISALFQSADRAFRASLTKIRRTRDHNLVSQLLERLFGSSLSLFSQKSPGRISERGEGPRQLKWVMSIVFFGGAVLCATYANHLARVEADEQWQKTHLPAYEVIDFGMRAYGYQRLEEGTWLEQILRTLPVEDAGEAMVYLSNNEEWVTFAFPRLGVQQEVDWDLEVDPEPIQKQGKEAERAQRRTRGEGQASWVYCRDCGSLTTKSGGQGSSPSGRARRVVSKHQKPFPRSRQKGPWQRMENWGWKSTGRGWRGFEKVLDLVQQKRPLAVRKPKQGGPYRDARELKY